MSYAADAGGSVVDLRVFERIRGFEADMERSIDSIVQQEIFRDEITNEHHRILVDHFQVQQTRLIHDAATKLLDAYLDEDDIVDAQGAPDGREDGGEDVLAHALRAFEARIADIREYHHAYRDLPAIRNTLDQPDADTLDRLFTPREHLGSCLDLEPHYERYSTFMIATATLHDATQEDNTNNTLKDATAVAPGMERRMRSSSSSTSRANRAEERLRDEASMRTIAGELSRHAPLWESRLDYVQFIAQLPDLLLNSIHAYRKVFGFTLYRSFVLELLDYGKHFYARVHPLTHELGQLLDRTHREAEEYWQALLQEREHLVSAAAAGEATGALTLSTAAARVAVGKATVMAGLHVPPALRRYSKSFALWPMRLIDDIMVLRESSATAASAPEGDANENNVSRIASSTSSSSSLRIMSMTPLTLSDVRELCIAEAQLIALTHTLLFHTVEETERTVRREYSRTSEELALERARVRQDFLDSLQQLQQRSTSSVESTVAQAAHYHVQATLLAAQEAEAARERAAMGLSGRAKADVAGDKSELDESSSLAGAAAPLLDEEGNPIPLWLVKLQQLDKKFVCEVCGGTVYRGPKAYYGHFGAERHAEGLRRLGVTRRLHEYEGIDRIRLVIELRDRLQSQKQGSSAAAEDRDAEYDGGGGAVVVSDLRRRLREDQDNEEMQDGQGKVITVKDYRRIQRRRT